MREKYSKIDRENMAKIDNLTNVDGIVKCELIGFSSGSIFIIDNGTNINLLRPSGHTWKEFDDFLFSEDEKVVTMIIMEKKKIGTDGIHLKFIDTVEEK